jgi:hypothetical protein
MTCFPVSGYYSNDIWEEVKDRYMEREVFIAETQVKHLLHHSHCWTDYMPVF